MHEQTLARSHTLCVCVCVRAILGFDGLFFAMSPHKTIEQQTIFMTKFIFVTTLESRKCDSLQRRRTVRENTANRRERSESG